MTKKYSVPNSNLNKIIALKVNNGGVKKKKCNTIRGGGQSGFKRPPSRTKVNKISSMMGKCSIKTKGKSKIYETSEKNSFQKILNLIKENEKRKKANSNARKMRETLKLFNRLHH